MEEDFYEVDAPADMKAKKGFFSRFKPRKSRRAQPRVDVQIMEPEAIEALNDSIEEIIPPPESPDPEEVDCGIVSDVPFAGSDPTATPGPVADFSPQPTPFDAVAIIKSPVIMSGAYANRSPGARGAALKRYGGGVEALKPAGVAQMIKKTPKKVLAEAFNLQAD